MDVTRREFVLLTASSCLVTLLPEGVLAAKPSGMVPVAVKKAPFDKNALANMAVVRAAMDKHHVKEKKTPNHLNAEWNHIEWGTVDVNGHKLIGPTTLLHPIGSANVIIDNKGNWEFMGEFGPSVFPYNVAIAVGLKGSLGKVMAFTAHGHSTIHNGFRWSKQGNSKIVHDLWPDVVKGHDWYLAARSRQRPPSSSGGSGGDSGGPSVGDVIGDVAGVLGAVFAFL